MTPLVAAAAVAALGVIAIVISIHVRRSWLRQHPNPHTARNDHAIRELRETRAQMEATTVRAKERTMRLGPTDDERIAILRTEVQVRTRDHSP